MEATEITLTVPTPREAEPANPAAEVSPRIQSLLARAIDDRTGEKRDYEQALTECRGQLDALTERVATLTADGEAQTQLVVELSAKVIGFEAWVIGVVEDAQRRMAERLEASLVAVVEALSARGAGPASFEATRPGDVEPLV